MRVRRVVTGHDADGKAVVASDMDARAAMFPTSDERKIAEATAREEGKPADVVGKIVEGQLRKWSKEVALLDQEHVRGDRYEGKTIEQIRAELAAKTGENVRIARFARFKLGED